jgi:hypothetical protein
VKKVERKTNPNPRGRLVLSDTFLARLEQKGRTERMVSKYEVFFFFLAVLGLELRASHLLGRHSST